MFDKIIISTPYDKVKVDDEGIFSDKPWKKRSPNEYFPEVRTVDYKYYGKYLMIQFSAPKIYHGNNLLEINQEFLKEAVEKLHSKLCSMGIEISFVTLWQGSQAYNMEICKNCNTDYLPSWVSLDYLRKFPVPRCGMHLEEDWHKKQARMNQCRFFGKAHEVTFYDKSQELRDRPQRNMKEFYYRGANVNILRFEVRLKKQAIQKLFDRKFISLMDLANEKGLYSRVVKKYWKPCVKASKYFPIYSSPLAQLALIKSKLDKQTYKDLLVFKSIEYNDGFCYARNVYEREFGKEETNKIIKIYKKYPIPSIVDYKYSVMDKLDAVISNPHWWHQFDDVFKENEHPFEFCECLVRDWWSTADSSKYLGICERTVQKMCKKGIIPCYVVGGKYRLKRSDVMDYQYQQ